MQDDTRNKLLLAGEELFAERGILPVSMREINKAAGQRNTSAIHYHFGSKDALIQAIFERRMRELNARRVELLDQVEARGEAKDLHAIVQASVQPLAEGLDGSPEDLNYILFFAQVLNESTSHLVEALAAPFSEGMRRTSAMIAKILKDLPEPLLRERMALSTEMTVYALAERGRRMRLTPERTQRLSNRAFVANLVDYICGGLTAVVSEETAASLDLKRSYRAKGGSSGSPGRRPRAKKKPA